MGLSITGKRSSCTSSKTSVEMLLDFQVTQNVQFGSKAKRHSDIPQLWMRFIRGE